MHILDSSISILRIQLNIIGYWLSAELFLICCYNGVNLYRTKAGSFQFTKPSYSLHLAIAIKYLNPVLTIRGKYMYNTYTFRGLVNIT